MIRSYIAAPLSIAVVTAACGGFTPVGEGGLAGSAGASGESGNGATAGAVTGGTGMGTGGSVAGAGGQGGSQSTGGSVGSGGSGGSGGTMTNPCEGRACGASCILCDSGDPNCAADEFVAPGGYCDADGNCGSAFPNCMAPECEVDADCGALMVPCQTCPDGSVACPTTVCLMGQCATQYPTCASTTCMTDGDCLAVDDPAKSAPCQICPDGTTSCPAPHCENGTCTTSITPCEGSNPCSDKICGEMCNVCPPLEDCIAVVMYCDDSGTCGYDEPVCEEPTPCMQDMDCPAVELCAPCPDAENACMEMRCVEGACKLQCPGGDMCAAEMASCANGETCCDGLTCCAGVPVPAGSEYCGVDCPDSDVNIKRDFESVNPGVILEKLVSLPIGTWAYRTEPGNRHIGPMAQDFMATFNVGSSDRSILPVDANGVAFAAIQALNARLVALEEENKKLKREVDRLSAR